MERKITRTQGNRYCTVEIRLNEGRLSITGEEGRVTKPASARKQAIEYWQSYFEEDAKYIVEMNDRCGTKFRSAKSAAKYVIETDGQYHGLDAKEIGDKVYILETCGQIVEEIGKWFPEVKPLLPWHLNDVRAGCVHQEELGWGWGKTIALTSDTLTEAQRLTITDNAERRISEKRQKAYTDRWNEIVSNESKAIEAIRAAKSTEAINTVTVYDLEEIRQPAYAHRPSVKKVQAWLKRKIEKEIPTEVFDAAIYKDSLMAPCPVCGYEYGSKWLKRELPEEIVKLAETVLTEKWIPVVRVSKE